MTTTIPASTLSLVDAYEHCNSVALRIKTGAQDLIDRSTAGPIAIKDIGDYSTAIADADDVLAPAIAIGTPLISTSVFASRPAACTGES